MSRMDGGREFVQLARVDAMTGEVSEWDGAEGAARKELPLDFYARGSLSAGKAAELAGTSRRVFEGWLGERDIVRPMDEADLRRDLEWAMGRNN